MACRVKELRVGACRVLARVRPQSVLGCACRVVSKNCVLACRAVLGTSLIFMHLCFILAWSADDSIE